MSSAARTVEDYVDEIMKAIREDDTYNLEEIELTLDRMKDSAKEKHRLNYCRVMQCLGEVAVDKMIEVLIRFDKSFNKEQFYFTTNSLIPMFVNMLCNMCVLKRVLAWKDKLVPIFFRAIRQTEFDDLICQGYDVLLRCLIVGKLHVAEMYLKLGLMKDIHRQIKLLHDNDKFDYVAVMCSVLLLFLAQLGKEDICKMLRRSAAMRVLGDYIVKIRLKKITRVGVNEIRDNFSLISTLMHDSKASNTAFQQWNSKEKLQEYLDDDFDENEMAVFCSAPNCRKIGSEEVKFRYCGACKLSRYCSEKCQKFHWKSGHKEACLRSPPE